MAFGISTSPTCNPGTGIVQPSPAGIKFIRRKIRYTQADCKMLIYDGEIGVKQDGSARQI